MSPLSLSFIEKRLKMQGIFSADWIDEWPRVFKENRAWIDEVFSGLLIHSQL